MDDAQKAAQRVLDAYELSGYGTAREHRYFPAFRMEDVLILARAVVGGTPDAT